MDNYVSNKINIDLIKQDAKNTREGIAIYDRQGKFTYINSEMASLYGYLPDEVIGESWTLFYAPDEIDIIESEYLPSLQQNGYWQGLLVGRKKDGETVRIEISLTPLFDMNHSQTSIICRTVPKLVSSKVSSQLLEQNQHYELVFNYSPILIAHISSESCYKIANKKYCEWFGIAQEKIAGMHIKDVLSQEIYEKFQLNIKKVLRGVEMNFEARVSHSSGELRWVNATYIPERNAVGDVIGFFAFIVDIDDKKQNERYKQDLMNAIDHGMEGFSLHDKNGRYIYVNAAEASMYGYSPDELIGESWKKLYDLDEISRIENDSFPKLLEHGFWRGELKGLKKTGELFDVEISLTLIKDEAQEPSGLFFGCRDISERKNSQREVDFLAFHDPLTRLPNRVLFKKKLEKLLQNTQKINDRLGILFIDLDYFKHVNDTLGHSLGDKLLVSVAERIKSIFRDEDLVARLSGDEFTVLLTQIKHKHSIEIPINKLLRAFRKPFLIENHEFLQSISIGVSVYPNDGKDAETLMKHADVAMYNVKEQGRQNYCFYTPGLSEIAQENLFYRNELQKAIENDELILYYQPIMCLENNKILGFEALLRWQHLKNGIVYPDKFIRHAEESNLIIKIGYDVIDMVCKQIKSWNQQKLEFEYVAINVSGVQLQRGFAETVEKILSKNQVATKYIQLEITENFLLKGLHEPIHQLNKLRDLGIRLAIDDFGVGYSSLSQLKQLPIQTLKIDRTFVSDIVLDEDDLAIVKAIIGLGKILKLDITAEGVENIEQKKLLEQLGCEKAQGYFYSKPVTPEAIIQFNESVLAQKQDQ